MTPQEATKLTRENRHKQDDEYIFDRIMEQVFDKIKIAAFNGENRVKDFMPYGSEIKYKYAVVNKLEEMGYTFSNGEEGAYGESYNIDKYIVSWKI